MSCIKALMLVPDQLQRPMGGMGVQLAGLIAGAQSDSRMLIVGSGGPAEHGPLHRYVPCHAHPILQLHNQRWQTAYAQADYLDAGLWLARKYGPVDVVHALDYSTGYAGIRLAQRLGKPLVVTFQLSQALLALDSHLPLDVLDRDYLSTAFALEMTMCREAQAVIHVSEAYSAFWSQAVPDAAGKMVVIPNGVDDPPTGITRPTCYGAGPNVLYIGRTCIQKGTHLLLDAIEGGQWPNEVQLYWAGDERGGIPQLWSRVLRLAQAGKINLLGYLQGDAKWSALQHADAVLMPSTHEPFGIVALEAMACGTPLITTGATGLGEFCDDSNSILIPATAQGIAAGVMMAMNTPAVERERLVAAGLATAQRFRWPAIAARLIEVYRSVLSKERRQ